jgi:hypothetical protein
MESRMGKKYTVKGKGFWFKVDGKYKKFEAGDTVELTEERVKKLRERLEMNPAPASEPEKEEPKKPETPKASEKK